jgi:tRNA U34 5-methylaminomethyl-2-thiouridine-forming methyltransferase MnmC
MSEIEIITTADGSHSLLNTDLNETYHSRHGAVQESKYVFIEQGLNYFCNLHTPQNISILEVGFGTGLNAWLTIEYLQASRAVIQYTTIETFPLPDPIWQSLNYATTDIEKNNFKVIHQATWNQSVDISDQFCVHKIETRLQDFNPTQLFNIIYFDAFAPNKQPELWELSILKKVVDALTPMGIFVTYCAKGQLKRDLKSLGLVVESLPGPPGKREMVRATKK